MRAQAAEEVDARQMITRLVADFGVARLVGSSPTWRRKVTARCWQVTGRGAAPCMRDFRIIQRAATMLRT
jgi:hypothetical protein